MNNIIELWIKFQICKMQETSLSTTTLSSDEPDYRNEPPEQREFLMPEPEEKHLCGGKLKIVKLW